jgi:hypothetical protein
MSNLADITARRRINSQNYNEYTNHLHEKKAGIEEKIRFVLFIFFIISIITPIYYLIGSIRITPYRLFLILFLISIPFLNNKIFIIRFKFVDLLIIIYCLWYSASIAINNGLFLSIEPSGVVFIETYGAFLVGRLLIQNATDMRRAFLTMSMISLMLLPFALYENFTGNPIIIEYLGKIFPVHEDVNPPSRHGLERAQVIFEHPILYGCFVASLFGFMITSSGKIFSAKNTAWSIVLATSTIASVSAGAIAAMAVQVLLIFWNHITKMIKYRWFILFLIFILIYVTIDVLSNRTPFHVIVSYLTFSENTGYSRIMIAEWGFAEVRRHPIWGIGLNDWARPEWKSASFDNFWLYVAMKSGLPAFIFLASAFWTLMQRVGNAQLQSKEQEFCRAGYLISMFGWIIAGCTVHFWNASYCLLMFMLGSGFWLTKNGAIDAFSLKSGHLRSLGSGR